MESGIRLSMNWLHTWTGVVLGALLFAIFWMGTLAVFDREIDRWMAPMTRLAMPDKGASFDQVLRPSYNAAEKANSPVWSVSLPTDRVPVLRIDYRAGLERVRQTLDPSTGVVLAEPGTWGGRQFIYPFHIHLHVRFWNIGIWLVGLSGMAMLVLCVSGIVIHRKVFADFFIFRPKKQSRRMILDLHNLTGVLAFPFHIIITLSGLIIFGSIYFPSGWIAAYKDKQTYNADGSNPFARPKLHKPGQTGSIDAMLNEARNLWDGDEPRFLLIRHPGDAAAFVQIFRSFEGRNVSLNADQATFDAATGTLLDQRTELRSSRTVELFIAGLHLIQFRHWTLRWAYFVFGLASCVLIGTGYLFWLESRRKQHAQLGLPGVRIVEGLTVGSTTGIVIATIAFFVVNRLLPLGTMFAGYERAALEAWAFYLVWIATFGHAWLRPGHVLIEQCWAIAVFAMVAVALNWITTGDHLIRSLMHPYLWPIAGMDLMLLGGALLSVFTAQKLQRRAADALAHLTPARARELHPAE